MHRLIAIQTTWFAVGLLVICSFLLASGNASANIKSGTISNGETITCEIYDVNVYEDPEHDPYIPIEIFVYWATDDNIDIYLKNPDGMRVLARETTTPYVEHFRTLAMTFGTYTLEIYGANISSAASISFVVNSVNHIIALSTDGVIIPGEILILLLIIGIEAVVIIVLLLVVGRKKQAQSMASQPHVAQQPVQQYDYQQPQQQYSPPPPKR